MWAAQCLTHEPLGRIRLFDHHHPLQVTRRLKTLVKRLLDGAVALVGATGAGRYLFERIVEGALGRVQHVRHGGCDLTFSTANTLNKYRADTFSSKEPETLRWIDSIPRGSVLWDVGANVGLYSCYAAKARGCRVFAFEPSVFNLEALARNLFLNRLTEQVTIVPLPLSDQLLVSKLRLTSTAWGAALSSFGQTYGHDGEPIRQVFEFSTLGLSMADAVELLKIPSPDYIKMDVDGIEHIILQGGTPVLRRVRGILVEINDEFALQAEGARRCLREAGLTLYEKTHADYFDRMPGAARHTFNQIWAR
ncbi:MAG: FkbM family methyltransferase [Gammaproteobacteria bacterium]|nr:FkbM family methyltransferase [Gammaproteobacteria bacterium]